MTRRLRVRPTVSVVAVLTVSLAAVPVTLSAGRQQYPESPYREPLSIETATDLSDRIPAHISVVDGAAELERDGTREAAEENVPLLAGDRLRTARGRVEVLFSDGSALSLDQNTDLDLLSDSLVRVQAGRIRMVIARGADDLTYRVDAAGTTTWLRSAGEYRIVVDNRSAEPDVFVAVLRGVAELESGGGRALIRAGLESRATARTQPSLPYAANVAAWDDFDRWVDEQQRYRSGARSAQYLPAELRHYGGAFDHNGGWEYEQGYGYVWFPTVALGWRPYHYGGWSFYAGWGWTWIGGGRWTWPTHHYGRWGWKTGRWFWIPGHRWAPAWVSWASAPGYLGWCPLGFDNRPVWSISYVNAYGGHGGYGWTVLPHNRFGPRVAVNRWAVSPGTLNLSGDRFTVHASSPVRPTTAVRQAEPLGAPTYASGRYAVARRSLSSGSESMLGRPAVVSTDTSSPAVARARVASASGRSSNPVSQPSGQDDGDRGRAATVRSAGPRSSPGSGGADDTADRGGSVRSASPRGRSSTAPPAPPSESQPVGRVSPRSSTPAPEAGAGGGSSSGGGARPRSRMSSSPVGPQSVPAERRATGRPTAPAFEPSPGMPARPSPGPGRLNASPLRRSIQNAPTRSPQFERSAPSRSAPVAPADGPRSRGASESRGQARSRNSG